MNCVNYNYKWYHAIIPSLDEFRYLCKSYDKTNLFLINLIRVIIYVYFAFLLYYYGYITYDYRYDTKFVFFISVIMILFSCISLMIVVTFKTQKLPKQEVEKEISEPVDDDLPNFISIYELGGLSQEEIHQKYPTGVRESIQDVTALDKPTGITKSVKDGTSDYISTNDLIAKNLFDYDLTSNDLAVNGLVTSKLGKEHDDGPNYR